MASTHSLPFSSSSRATSTRPAQLPLPSSSTAPSLPPTSTVDSGRTGRTRPLSGTNMGEEATNSAGTASSRPNSPPSAGASPGSPRLRQALSVDTARGASPTFYSFQSQLSPGTTHASGIQPSVSFFRPSRPNQAAPFSPTSGTVLQNLEKVIRRGLSFDSSKRSTSSRANMSMDGPTLENKVPDEERGFGTGSTMNTFPMGAPDSRSVGSRRSPSLHVPSFNPVPPDRRPRLSAVPVLDPATGQPLRNYRRHPSRNKFFLNGRLLTGGDSPLAFIASIVLMLAITGIWFGTTAVWWNKNESPAVVAVGAYLCLITIQVCS
jgi:hypothetical protein